MYVKKKGLEKNLSRETEASNSEQAKKRYHKQLFVLPKNNKTSRKYERIQGCNVMVISTALKPVSILCFGHFILYSVPVIHPHTHTHIHTRSHPHILSRTHKLHIKNVRTSSWSSSLESGSRSSGMSNISPSKS